MNKIKMGSGLLTAIGATAILAGCGNSNQSQSAANNSISSIDMSAVYSNNISGTIGGTGNDEATSTSSSKAKNVVEHNAKSSSSSTHDVEASLNKLPANLKKMQTKLELASTKVTSDQGTRNVGTKKHPDDSKDNAIAYANNEYAQLGHTFKSKSDSAIKAKVYDSMTKVSDMNEIFTTSAAKNALNHITNDAKTLNAYYQKHDFWK